MPTPASPPYNFTFSPTSKFDSSALTPSITIAQPPSPPPSLPSPPYIKCKSSAYNSPFKQKAFPPFPITSPTPFPPFPPLTIPLTTLTIFELSEIFAYMAAPPSAPSFFSLSAPSLPYIFAPSTIIFELFDSIV